MASGWITALIISFDTRQLRSICRDIAAAESLVGVEQAGKLRQVLADFRAAETFYELSGLVDLPTGDELQLEIQLGTTHSLVVRCGNRRPARLVEGGTNLNTVDRIKVMEIKQNDP
jgi:hypothetical protein